VIILLDLNHTLSTRARGASIARPFFREIQRETYRQWLVELIRDKLVVLITARPQRYQVETLNSIRTKTGWLPEDWYFNGPGMMAPAFKDWIVRHSIFPTYGNDPALYLALESNPITRAVYARLGIRALEIDEGKPWERLPA
jgi:hypothetical protein